MSGIIGGAGSKSGMIGTTELPYEEGTFTVGWAASDGNGTYTMGVDGNTGYYCRIGNNVTFQIQASCTGTGGGTGYLLMNSLPFAVSASHSSGNPKAGGGMGRVGGEAAQGFQGWYTSSGSAVIYFAYFNTNGYWYYTNASKVITNTYCYFSGSYVCVP